MWLLMSLIGCKVAEAPEELQSLMTYGFVHTEDDDSGPMEEVAEGLPPLVVTHEADLDAGYRVDSLTLADLEAVGLRPEREIEVVGVAYMVEMQAGIEEIAPILAGDELDQVFAKTFEYSTQSRDDLSCFLAHECEIYHNHGTRVTDMGLFGEATQEFDSVFRWVEMPDGSQGLALRQVSPRPTEMTTDLVTVHQSYNWALMYEEGGKTRRVEAYWADVEIIDLDVQDSVVLDLAVGTNKDRAVELDAYLGYSSATPEE